MDLGKLSKPIVMAKPVRGREMQSTIIPKDVVDTVRAVSTKQTKGESIAENLQKPREGDVEVYHEGYVDGKLYLVPDTNLQAMRDIVNLKMKRRHSSAEKPQTSSNEPTQYTEFKSKLDSLLEKIDELADSSYDESESMEGSESLKKKKEQDLKEKSDKPNTITTSLIQEEPDEKTRETLLSNTNKKNSPKRVTISPMMDENISYIRTRPTSTKSESSSEQYNSGLQTEGKYNKDSFDFIDNTNVSRQLTTETFRLLISGHLKDGAVPIFINHQNYAGPNILENETPDFKTHKKEGNIDIFISGKFFTFDILKEESFESPAILDLKPHKIIIDKDYDIHRKKFKDIYKVGPLEVVLKGEFKKNSTTLKYTPVFSLNIVKNPLFAQNSALDNFDESPTTVLCSEQNDDTPFRNNQQTQPISSNKHVHYASENKETLHQDADSINDKSPKDKSLLGILKNNMIYKKLFCKNEESVYSDKSSDNEFVSSNQQIKARTSKSKREELARLRRSRLKDRNARRGKNKKLYNISQEGHNVLSQKELISDKVPLPLETTGASMTSKNIPEEDLNIKKVKKVRRAKKKDKNQAIVENPILAQMQEFFIA